ncbi:RluA family pseudouridine synthase [uncultured Pseudodesulfovibrio sp.]|uniref:RluA family pseudouridine synthase n=1 Tax=uncultured Pseudodesulfovibrio sp. TaxID=2035858 RepID=UPI0029C709F0|nr:RluA family pseudouridine synthase [uncultured Pseudodesulfovibrio sp.]
MAVHETYEVSAEFDGSRLDRFMVEIMPESGLRLRRRLCDEGRVLVDGKSRKPGYKLRSGQEIIIGKERHSMSHEQMGLRIVEQAGDFAAVYKPGGVHSASIEGKGGDCVEDVLADLFPGTKPHLLNRLDYLTSGLLLVALNADAVDQYHVLEDRGDIRKFYLADVKGRLDGMVTVRNALDTDNRKKTRVLDEDHPDERRWTDVDAVSHDRDNDTSLVRCLIMKGARHQIRAHLASLGHPILGDPLYGDGSEGDCLRLHHERIEMPGFTASVACPWGLV